MPHTTVMLITGLALLIAMRILIGDKARATCEFLVLWLIISIGNLLVGVLSAGYGWGEELLMWLLVFGTPAVLALVAARISSRG